MEDIDHDSCNCDDSIDNEEKCDSKDFAEADHNNIVEDHHSDEDQHSCNIDIDRIEDNFYTSADVLETFYQQCQMEEYTVQEEKKKT